MAAGLADLMVELMVDELVYWQVATKAVYSEYETVDLMVVATADM